MSLKLILSGCWLALFFIYLRMSSYRDVTVIQSMLGPVDMFLALAVPVGFSKSIVLYVNDKHITVKGALFSLSFLLIFTFSQVMHGMTGNVLSDTLTMAQEPPLEKMIARHIDKAFFDPLAEERVKSAAFLYLVSGVKTIYKSQEDQYEVFTPNQKEREERKQWERRNALVDEKKNEIFDQVTAIRNRSTFHIVVFFVLFSVMLIVEVIQVRTTGNR